MYDILLPCFQVVKYEINSKEKWVEIRSRVVLINIFVNILADIKRNIKIKIYIGTKTTFDFSDTKKILFFNVKYFIFCKFICEIYILADIK